LSCFFWGNQRGWEGFDTFRRFSCSEESSLSCFLVSVIIFFFYRIENHSQLHEDVLNDEIREPDPIEDFCGMLNSWLKKKGLVMPYFLCVGTSGSGPSQNFIMTCQCHHVVDLAIGRVCLLSISLNPATPLSYE
jgi:hypothetical protein